MQVQVTNNMGSVNPPKLKVKALKFQEPYYHFEINYCDKSAPLVESVNINVILDEENININDLNLAGEIWVNESGDKMSGQLDMGSNNITNIGSVITTFFDDGTLMLGSISDPIGV